MDGDYEIPQPDAATYHDYFEPINIYEYDSVDVTSPSRDSQYEELPPGDDRPVTARTSSHEYTPLNSLPTAGGDGAPPAYEPGLSAT